MLKARRWIGRHLGRDEGEMHQGRVSVPPEDMVRTSQYKQEPMTKARVPGPQASPSAWRKRGLALDDERPGRKSHTRLAVWFPWDEVAER